MSQLGFRTAYSRHSGVRLALKVLFSQQVPFTYVRLHEAKGPYPNVEQHHHELEWH